MWRISRIRLKDFKVYSGEYSFELAQLTFVVGRVGAGKSSLLQAIEFALLGKEMEVRRRIAKLADLINIEAEGALVELELSAGSERAVIRRTLNRRGRGKLELRIGDERYVDDEAERKLQEITGVSSDDYDRVIYISHYALEDFIHGDRLRRTSTIDKILQIDVLENTQRLINNTIKNIMKELEKIKIKISFYEKYKNIIDRYGNLTRLKEARAALEKELEEISKKEEELASRYRRLLEERQKYVDKIANVQDKIEAYYRAKSELELLEESGYALTAELGQMEELRDKFVGVLSEFEHIVGPQVIESISKEPDAGKLAELLQDAYGELVKARSALEEALSSTEAQRRSLAARLSELEAEISKLRIRIEQLEASYKRFKELEEKYGAPSEAKRRLEALREKAKELERRTSYISSLRHVLAYVLETNADFCPVCGARLDKANAASRLSELERVYAQELRQMEETKEELEALEGAYKELESLLVPVSEYLKAKDELKRLSEEANRVRARLEQATKSAAQISKRLQLLTSFLKEVTPEAIQEVSKRYNKALRARRLREELEALERDLRNLGIGRTVLESEEEFQKISDELSRIRKRKADIYDELRKLSEVLNYVDEDLDALRSKLDKYIYSYNRLSNIINKLDMLKQNIKERIIKEIKNELAKNFAKIYPYKDIESVDLSLRDKAYEVDAKLADGNVIGISRLSDGQRLAVALSLVISIRELLRPKLGFLLLDDPLPYVDPHVRSALAKLIASLGNEYQVVVATQTEELPREVAANGVDVEVIELSRDKGKPEVTTKHIFGGKD